MEKMRRMNFGENLGSRLRMFNLMCQCDTQMEISGNRRSVRLIFRREVHAGEIWEPWKQ